MEPIIHASLPSTGWRNITHLALIPVDRLAILRTGGNITVSCWGLDVSEVGARRLLDMPPGFGFNTVLGAQGMPVLNDPGTALVGKLQFGGTPTAQRVEWKCAATNLGKGYAYLSFPARDEFPLPSVYQGWEGL